jgi:hypothetical protein
MNEIATSGFDYGQLDGETWKFVQDARDEIRRLGRQTIRSILEIGGHLAAVKERLPWGQWGAWLAAEFPWISERTADNWINSHVRLSNSATVAELDDAELDRLLDSLSPTGLYALSAPGTPETAIEEVVDRVMQGEVIPPKEVKEIVGKHRDEKPTKKFREMEPRMVKLQRVYYAMTPRERNQAARWVIERELEHTSLGTSKGANLEKMLKALTFARPEMADVNRG